MAALANAKAREAEQRETVAASIVNARLQIPPRMGNRDEWPIFETWCREKGLRCLPARPATIAFWILDNVALGIDRLLRVVESISAVHEGLADPTLSPVVTAALATIAPIAPPRHWPKSEKHLFTQMPRALQTFVAAHEMQQDKAFRTATNKALAKLKLENSNVNSQSTTEPAAALA
jgi:hypothetical protein